MLLKHGWLRWGKHFSQGACMFLPRFLTNQRQWRPTSTTFWRLRCFGRAAVFMPLAKSLSGKRMGTGACVWTTTCWTAERRRMSSPYVASKKALMPFMGHPSGHCLYKPDMARGITGIQFHSGGTNHSGLRAGPLSATWQFIALWSCNILHSVTCHDREI